MLFPLRKEFAKLNVFLSPFRVSVLLLSLADPPTNLLILLMTSSVSSWVEDVRFPVPRPPLFCFFSRQLFSVQDCLGIWRSPVVF